MSGMPGYIEWLRSKVGHRKIILPYATALVHDDQGRLLFQRRTDFDWWGLPGGVLEIGEDFETCAVRETLEETGLRVQAVCQRGLYTAPEFDVLYPNGDEVQQYTVTVECRLLDAGGGQPDGLETTEQRFFSAEEAAQLHLSPWYARMAQHYFERPKDSIYFDPPATLPTDGNWWLGIRQYTGSQRLITLGAGAIIQNESGQILLTFRQEGLWGIPAGLMELGETISGTIVREAKEEMNADIVVRELIGAFTGPDTYLTYPDGNQAQIVSTLFRADLLSTELTPDGTETRDLGWFHPEHLPPMVERHRKLLQYALAHPAKHA
jgi:ADP-ribose pyrophosphatase YjhB (NUDIX family)